MTRARLLRKSPIVEHQVGLEQRRTVVAFDDQLEGQLLPMPLVESERCEVIVALSVCDRERYCVATCCTVVATSPGPGSVLARPLRSAR